MDYSSYNDNDGLLDLKQKLYFILMKNYANGYANPHILLASVNKYKNNFCDGNAIKFYEEFEKMIRKTLITTPSETFNRQKHRQEKIDEFFENQIVKKLNNGNCIVYLIKHLEYSDDGGL